jgi:hypothetical protein
MVEARNLARDWSPRAVEKFYGVMTDRSASIANQLAAAQGTVNVAQLMETEAATAMPTQSDATADRAGHIRRRAPNGS